MDGVSQDRAQQYLLSSRPFQKLVCPPGPLPLPPFGHFSPKRISPCFARMLSEKVVVGRQLVLGQEKG